MDIDENTIIWNIIDCYFKSNPNWCVKHHIDSYNSFFKKGLKQLLQEKNPIRILKEQDPKTKIYKYQCDLYLGGKKGDLIYYGKPIIYDEDRAHFMYPNEARLRNMTYGFSIHYDVVVEYKIIINGKETIRNMILPKIYLGRFPIMLQSDLCLLKGLSPDVRFNMGECRDDWGGYFIIDGKEKVIISQEKFADNMLYITDSEHKSAGVIYSHAAKIRSVSEDASKPTRTLAIRIVAPSATLQRGQIVVDIPQVRKPVPLFILMRALGVISDKEIIQTCLLDLEKEKECLELFRPSVHDAARVFTQQTALKFISTFIKLERTSVGAAMQILSLYLLPHIGELNFKQKALYIGYVVKRLLNVYIKNEPATDRDNFKFKRIETSGELIGQLFKEYYNLQWNHIYREIDKDYYYHKPQYQEANFYHLIENNVSKIFSQKVVHDGFKKAFKGNWGAQTHTKRPGVIQDLSRLSYFGFISHLRKLNIPLPADAKVVGPRLLHGTQWGIECPIHTPDGGNIGLHKHLSIITHISSGTSGYPFISLLRKMGMTLLEESSIEYLSKSTKVFINGAWIGVIKNPPFILRDLKNYRRNGLIPIFTSIQWNITKNEILILTDKGRAMRPIFYIMGGEGTEGWISWGRKPIVEKIKNKTITWKELVMGIGTKKPGINIEISNGKIYEPREVFSFGDDIAKLTINGNVIDYMDTQEAEGTFIAIERENSIPGKTTHVEIHPSLVLGIMANMVIFPENNPLPRDLFSCGQSKQAVSLYSTNFQNRIDKMGIILNYGQIPLIKSRYLKIATNEKHPYGENAIVAIACYSGYNVEDAIIVNKASLERGIFRTTYFNMYEAREESSQVVGSNVDTNFCYIHDSGVIRLKMGYDYSHLNKDGIIIENTKLNDKIVLIGRCTTDVNDPSVSSDSSVVPKKGQLGYVDKSFMTEGEEGFRLAKVRVRHERLPAIGDKFCSRAGQKGTIGIILPECDMPFSANGVRPDIIVNPHAFPSRMTIGHLIESLVGKACALYGAFGDCTAWNTKGPKDVIFGKMLTQEGFHSSGTEILYNGMTGDQMEADIYFGPTYYLRLKHMVKDKINYRARGPRTVLTRQTVQGRANNGGLRIGEMDRDAVVGHGMASFLEESMMERGDKFFMAICNQTGSIAVYNENKNIFLSPMSDGPLKFSENLDNTLNIINISRFGRDFSVIRVPYAFKLLHQELKTMNIQMRLITEDNIDNLTNIIHSDNVYKLTGLESMKSVMAQTISKLTGKPFTEAQKLTEIDQDEKLEEKEEKITEDEGEQAEDNEDAIMGFDNIETCKEWQNRQFRAFNSKYSNVKTDMPYVLDDDELKEKIIDNLIIRPQPAQPLEHEMKTNIEDKLNVDFFNHWTNNSKINTLDYLFNKIRAGYYLKIQNGVLKSFIPLYNVNFKNTWGNLLNIDNLKNKDRINQNREQWVATNCLLQLEFKPLVDEYNLDTYLEVKNMFSELCAHRNIPDIDLLINVKDFPLLKKDLTEPFNHIYNSKTKSIENPKNAYYPLLGFNSSSAFTDIAIPTNHEWQVVTQKIWPGRCMNDYKYPTRKVTWAEKQPTAVFRGTATGCGKTAEGNQRILAAKLDKEWSKNIELNGEKEGEYPYLNAAITKFPNRYKTTEGSDDVFYCRNREYVEAMKEQVSIKQGISMQNQSRYKYILNIAGNSSAYRLSYLLRSGSVILNVEFENKLWWESKWEPMKHYVPVKSDLSDLKEQIEWCRTHDDECVQIVKNASSFADQYITKDAIFNYLEAIVNNILLKGSDDIQATMGNNNAAEKKKYRVNIIVPFRDGGDQTRTKHLEFFRNRMSIFLPKVVESLTAQGWDAKFDVTVIEQSPEHSFNRGALLNIGFKLDETYDAYIFHDVDLIPEDIMIPVYAGPYGKNAIAHFASEWGRYKNPYKYLGGVLLVGGEIFKRANGFPNNYYGWGGEDDELRRRFETLLGENVQEYVTLVGKEGGLRDLEQIQTAREKLGTLQDKNPVRWEGKAKHDTTWRENGLNKSDFYEVLSTKDGETDGGVQYKIYTVKLNSEEIPPFEADQQVEQQHKKPFVQSGGAMPNSALAKSTMPNSGMPNAEKAALLDREFNKKINELVQTKEQLLSEFKPKETIMFKEIPKEKEFSVEDLGQDLREKRASITIHDQFPVKDVTPVRQFPSVIEEHSVNVARSGPSPKEAEMERIKRRTEVGGLKWDRDTIKNLKK